MSKYPIGVFDSGYGGLTILRDICRRLPEYDYVYLGDNARAPYGTRSFSVVHEFTLQAVTRLFEEGCRLVVLACNTASAKALRTIQQQDLPAIDPSRRVLGVIRPTVEALGGLTKTRHIGVLGTPGTVQSESYVLEMRKQSPDVVVEQRACPMWVPIVECGEASSEGADWFVKKYLTEIMRADPQIDTLVLGCTHYPLLIDKIRKHTPADVSILQQGPIVAASLEDYLHRHPEIESQCSRSGSVQFLTTESPEKFNPMASLFLGREVEAQHVTL